MPDIYGCQVSLIQGCCLLREGNKSYEGLKNKIKRMNIYIGPLGTCLDNILHYRDINVDKSTKASNIIPVRYALHIWLPAVFDTRRLFAC